ncbi:MAG TPA: cupin domain-containing protein [Thermoanaerobaculia bacterium]|nr:cupin domain-containing protein [Thermoanaerobaculia bacterium]
MISKIAVLAALLPAVALAQPPASEVAIDAEPHHHLVLENAWVRAFQVEVAPHAATLMHRHKPDYVFVTLGAAEIENDVAGKPPVSLKLQDGETRFSAGNFAHVAKNLADTPFRNVTIELLQPGPATAWGSDEKPRELGGGTITPVFVKDGVRVSDVRLKAGGVLPRHHHDGPHLLVAVTDLSLRNEVEGQSAVTRTLKAGEVAWIPGGITHTVTNVGAGEARLITLEF